VREPPAALPDAATPSFQPKTLGRRDLEVAVGAGLRRMSPEDRDRWIGERQAWHGRFRAFSPRVRHRALLYAVAGAIGFPILNSLLHLFAGAPLGWNVLWIQVPAAALYGAVVAVLRPSRAVCGLLFGLLAAGVLFAAYPGSGGLGFAWTVLMHVLLYGCFGVAIGAAEDLKRADGS
jgi:hypothetical protein